MADNNILIPILVGAILLIFVIMFFLGCWFIRKRRKFKESLETTSYAVNEDSVLIPRNSRQTTEHQQPEDSSILLSCHFYIRTTGEYTFHSQLPQLGSSQNKNWFLLTHTSKKGTLSLSTGSHLLTIQPKSDRLNQLNDEDSAIAYIKTLNNLFNRLFHPYIEPINRLDILYTQKLVVTVRQYQRLGSLKDVIQGATPSAAYQVNK